MKQKQLTPYRTSCRARAGAAEPAYPPIVASVLPPDQPKPAFGAVYKIKTASGAGAVKTPPLYRLFQYSAVGPLRPAVRPATYRM